MNVFFWHSLRLSWGDFDNGPCLETLTKANTIVLQAIVSVDKLECISRVLIIRGDPEGDLFIDQQIGYHL